MQMGSQIIDAHEVHFVLAEERLEWRENPIYWMAVMRRLCFSITTPPQEVCRLCFSITTRPQEGIYKEFCVRGRQFCRQRGQSHFC